MYEVVCNASPLIFLAKIGQINLLDNYTLYIPSQVESAIHNGIKRKKEDAQIILRYLKNKNTIPSRVTILKDLSEFLGEGEKAVISLAVKKNIKRVFIDEAKARTVARFKGLSPKGTLGILWDSYKNGKLDKIKVEVLLFELTYSGM
ncbi:MAG: hypothetical protein ACUBOA_09325 [Candidatus Loosdrechtia sp.]|uniref:hypothetical protein n=1 Tax=Candidatus Loosdrechtia sp. TaxID=3101272 RepID=UPI003A61316A|nr:MAG: hypothetical protein QY305_00725 [Candidatus Jettenia sp. AMX2]